MVRNVGVVSTLAILGVLLLLVPAGSQVLRPDEKERLCGPRSFVAACAMLGVHTTLQQVERLTGYEEAVGTSMLGLQHAADAMGLHAAAMKISAEDLCAARTPAIAFLWGDHFAVVESGGTDTVIVSDPPNQPESMKIADFRNTYSGFALVISKDAARLPVARDEGAYIRLSSYDWDFGSLFDGERASCSIKFRNVGKADLLIYKVEASCSCLQPTGFQTVVTPGGEGKIDLVLDTTGQSTEVAKALFITSNDTITPVVQVQVVGYVKSRTLRHAPHELTFGNARRNGEAAVELYVPSTKDEPVRVISAQCDSPHLAAKVVDSADSRRPGAVIRLALKSGAPIGPLRGKLVIQSDHPLEPVAEVPITATIKGNIDLDLDTFFLGIVKQGKGAVANVTISTVSKDPLKIGKIDNPVNCVAVDVKPKTDPSTGSGCKEYVLTATLKPDAPLGNIKGEITVHTNDPDQPEIKIPVYAYVEK